MKYKKMFQVFLLILIFFLFTKDILPQAGELDATFGQGGIVTTAINISGFESRAQSVALQSDGKIVAADYSSNGSDNDFTVVRYNIDGSLNNAFGVNGIVTTRIGTSDERVNSIAIQSDGKIVAAGFSDNGGDLDIAIVRYNTDGMPDDTFGMNGIVTTQLENSDEEANSVAIQNDGKIIVAGYSDKEGDDDFAILRYNTNGGLDNTFGTNGIVTTDIEILENVANSVAIQNDGKIVVAGFTIIGVDERFVVIRYNTDGTLDDTFGTNGIANTQVDLTYGAAYSVTIQSNGKIVAAGYSYAGFIGDHFVTVRYDPDGNLDNTFGTNGIVSTPLSNFGSIVRSVVIQSDGKIITAGYFHNGNNYDIALVRYNTNGTLDNAFGTDGIMTGVGASNDGVYSAAIQNDGKIVAAGSYEINNKDNFAITRYNTDGSLDNTFAEGGKVITPLGISLSVARSITIQDDEKIVAAGDSHNGSDNDFAIARYNTDGTLDNTFGVNGIVTSQVGTSDDYATSAAIQSDGKILVAGASDNGNDHDFAVVRYNINGFLDNAFGTGGVVTTQIGTSTDRAYSVAVQGDGKIVAAGQSYNGSDDDFAIVRYNQNGSLDNTFGTGGMTTTNIGSDDESYSSVIQSNGKIIVAGHSYNGSNFDIAIVRYNTDGNLDNTFGTNGVVTTQIGTSDDEAKSVAIQSDGKIIIAGYSYNGNNFDIAIVRYNTDGTLDNSFGTNGIVTTLTGVTDGIANSVVIQSAGDGDGKILVDGYSSNGSYNDIVIVRYNTDGSLDDTFGTDGIVTTRVGASLLNIALSTAIQSDGKFVVGGYSSNGSNYSVFSLIRYTADPVTGIFEERGEEKPTDFALLQNYPNPFNPTTKIKIVIPKSSFVNLKVYDVLGKEIATLVNKEMPAGVYKVNFDATGLSSGVYFYKIQAGEFVQTKKMILLR